MEEINALEITRYILIAVIAAIPIFLFSVMRSLSHQYFNDLKNLVKKSGEIRDSLLSEKIGDLIASVSPRVVYCSGPEDVTREAVDLIEQALTKFDTHRKARAISELPKSGSNENDKDPDSTIGGYMAEDFITIYGSASLGERLSDGSKATDEAVDVGSPADQFRSAMHRSMQAGIRFRRYVHLLDPKELPNRRPEIGIQYAHWIGRQYEELVHGSTAELVDNVRAPLWGTANTSFLANAGILEIKAGGNAALAVYDPVIAATMRRSMRDEIEKAQPKNNRHYSATSPESVDELRLHVIEVCKVIGIDPGEVAPSLSGPEEGTPT